MGTSSKRANRVSIIIVWAAAVAAGAQTTSQPVGTQPATLPGASAATSAPAVDPAVDQILDRLEQRAVRNLRAKVAWRQQYLLDLPEDVVTKRGDIWYQQAVPVAKFRIHFVEQTRGSRRDVLDEQHLFDGQWYIEVQSRTKTYTKREVRRPNDPGNPYKIGAGVFPLPFGQKKADVLGEFTVIVVPPTPDDPAGTDHLRLVPQQGTNTGQNYKELEFWVEREGAKAGLPSKVRVAKLDGTGKVNSHITITFDDAHLDEPGFAASVFEIEPPAGYERIEERLEDIPPPPAAAEPKP